MRVDKINLYVLNYNGEELLQECLPSIIASIDGVPSAKLFVIDNKSTDNSLAVLKEKFSKVSVLLPSENKFLCSFNEYVKQADADIVILMNNDIKVSKDFLKPIIQAFESHDDAFFVSSYCRDFSETKYEGGLSTLKKWHGWWGTFSVDPKIAGNFQYTASIGACIAFKTNRFNELNGFDDLYLPGTLEDLDVCYRGWKKGWKGYFAPASEIFHKGQATFKAKFGSPKIRELAMRNTFLFIWKNILDQILLLEHVLWLVPRLLFSLIRGDFAFVNGFFGACARFQKAWNRRQQEKKITYQVIDRDVLNVFKALN